MRAVGYVRVSSEEQVQGLSLDAQRREIARYCEQHGHELLEVYADEGVSAYTDQIAKRPAFSALLEAAASRAFDVVVVHTLDRWARRSSVQATTLERLGRAGVGFASVSEQLDYTTPSGKLSLTMMGGVAEFFSAQLGVHVRKAKREGFEQGRFAGGVPFGYRSEQGVAIVEPAEADAVREVFMKRARGDSHAAIARGLNAGGFTTRRGNPFTSFAVKDMLRCRFYLGLVSYKGVEGAGAHEAILDRALFEGAQQRRQERRAAPRHPWRTHSLLAGRVKCARCGRALWSDRTRGGAPLYREQHDLECVTKGRSMVAAPIDDQIGALFGAMRLDEALLVAALRGAEASDLDGPSIDDVDAELRRLGRAYADGIIPDAEYEGRLSVLRTRRAALVAPVSRGGLSDAAELVRDLPRLWSEASIEQRRDLVCELLEQVDVDLEERRVEGIVAVPAFDELLRGAAVTVATDSFRLVPAGGGCGGDGGELNSPSRERQARTSTGVAITDCSYRRPPDGG